MIRQENYLLTVNLKSELKTDVRGKHQISQNDLSWLLQPVGLNVSKWQANRYDSNSQNVSLLTIDLKLRKSSQVRKWSHNYKKMLIKYLLWICPECFCVYLRSISRKMSTWRIKMSSFQDLNSTIASLYSFISIRYPYWVYFVDFLI